MANLLAYFDSADHARAAAGALEEIGCPALIDTINRDVPDPDFSVSELMIGFLPDLAHGIFGSGREFEASEKRGAVLLALVRADNNEQEVQRLLGRYGGRLIPQK